MIHTEFVRGALAPPLPRCRRAPVGEAFVSAFVCAGTERIGRSAGFPVAVVAASHEPGLHAGFLSATRHAGWSVGTAGGTAFASDGDDPMDFIYRVLPLDPRWLGRTPLPTGVRIARGSLAVALPAGASVRDVSSLLCSGLAGSSYERVARRPERVRQRLATGRPPLVSPRYAMASPGDDARLAPVDDLFHFRPRDLPTVAAALALAVGSLALACGLDPAASRDDAGARHA